MPYKEKNDLPENVRDALPAHAQEIYKEAFNNAWEQYDDPDDRREDQSREATAHQIAWSAVTNEYEKVIGDWKKK